MYHFLELGTGGARWVAASDGLEQRTPKDTELLLHGSYGHEISCHFVFWDHLIADDADGCGLWDHIQCCQKAGENKQVCLLDIYHHQNTHLIFQRSIANLVR